ncbi:hypothetical protein DFH11DRAFT_878795 [Phellopilus nigrolimitatus]|nr:hypothetical protein DFH11DRAFT_878795 [Phellopilus nigrolimitatus]
MPYIPMATEMRSVCFSPWLRLPRTLALSFSLLFARSLYFISSSLILLCICVELSFPLYFFEDSPIFQTQRRTYLLKGARLSGTVYVPLYFVFPILCFSFLLLTHFAV